MDVLSETDAHTHTHTHTHTCVRFASSRVLKEVMSSR